MKKPGRPAGGIPTSGRASRFLQLFDGSLPLDYFSDELFRDGVSSRLFRQ
jgi:hypothetical protein